MPEFEVRIHQPPSGVRRVRVTAERESAVAAALGIAPAQVLEVAAVAPPPMRAALDARLFAQELATLLDAGVPLLEAVQTLREKDAGAAVLDAVVAALREGHPLSAALSRAGAVDALFVAIVAASERSGQLARTLVDHAAYLTWAKALRERLAAAAAYPLMLVAAGGAVVLFLLLYVLPRFAGIFDDLGHELPWASRRLIALAAAAHAHPMLTLAVAAALPLAAFVAAQRPSARAALVALSWRLPGLGGRLRSIALARLYRLLALLLGAGLPALQALQLAEGVPGAAMAGAVRRAAAEVSGGRRLSQALQSQGLATPVALRMLRVGESGGAVAAMLARAAAFHDEEIARLSEFVARVVSPLLMLVMGTLIGAIVVLMYMPIFTLMESVQ